MAEKQFTVLKREGYGDIFDPIDLTSLLLFRSVGAIFCLYRVVHPPFSFSLLSLEVQQAMIKNHNTESKSPSSVSLSYLSARPGVTDVTVTFEVWTCPPSGQ